MGKKTTKHINDVMNNVVAEQINSPTIDEAKALLNIGDSKIVIEGDAFIGNPYSLLGKVLVKNNDETNKKPVFHMFSVKTEVDEESKISQPLKTKSLLVDKHLSSNIELLNFLSSKLDTESLFSITVFNQAVGLVDDKKESYKPSVGDWIESSKVFEGYDESEHLLIKGFVQKNIIRKRYKKFDIKNKGGAYGINYNGNLYTSTEDYSLDVRFQLTVSEIKKLKSTDGAETSSSDFADFELVDYVADEELHLTFNT